MRKVIIADQHPATIKGLASKINKDKEAYKIIGKYTDFESLKTEIENETPDILILDLNLPNLGGLSEFKLLKNALPNTRILIFSQLPENLYALSAIKAGASGYLSKRVTLRKFKKALDNVARGGIHLSDEINNQISKSPRLSKNSYKKLSTREVEVLDLISKGKRNKDIASVLQINEKTVSTYKSRLQKKLRVDNVAGLIQQYRTLAIAN